MWRNRACAAGCIAWRGVPFLSAGTLIEVYLFGVFTCILLSSPFSLLSNMILARFFPLDILPSWMDCSESPRSPFGAGVGGGWCSDVEELTLWLIFRNFDCLPSLWVWWLFVFLGLGSASVCHCQCLWRYTNTRIRLLFFKLRLGDVSECGTLRYRMVSWRTSMVRRPVQIMHMVLYN